MPGRRRPSADARRTYDLLVASSTFCFALSATVSVIYMATRAGLDPLQLVVVGTVLEATCFLFEIPTGVVADLRSRRLSVIIGFVLIGFGFVLQGGIAAFWSIVLAQVIWGIGYTFTSGATEAWITDEIGEEAIDVVFIRAQRVGLVAGFAGTVAAGALSLIDIQLPMVLSGVGMIGLAIGLVVAMPEQHFHPTPVAQRETFAHLLHTARSGLGLARRSVVVGGLLAVSVFAGLSSEAFDRLWQVRLIDDLGLPKIAGLDRPGTWFAGFGLIGSLVALGASFALGRPATGWIRTHPGRLLAVLAAVDVAGMAGLALFGSLWLALAAVWVKQAAAAVAQPAVRTWLNRQLPSQLRATALSMNGQANAIGQVIGGPPLGLLGTRTRPAIAILAAAALATPIVAIYAIIDRGANRRISPLGRRT